MIVQADKETINESLGISNDRSKEIGDILRPIFDESNKNGVFDGVKAIIQIEASGKIKTIQEWFLVFFRIGIFLGGLFEKDAAEKRAKEAMKQFVDVVKIEGIKRPPKKTVIN